MKWSPKERVLGVVCILAHAAVIWLAWDAGQKTPRNIQIISCDGEVVFEGEMKKPSPQQEPRGMTI